MPENMTLRSDEKIYTQVARSLEDDIISGLIREGEPVPSTHHYAAYFEINPSTAAKGVALLSAAGLLTKKRGIGLFVAEGAREQILERRREEFKKRTLASLLDEAARIGVSKRDLIAMIASA